MISGDTGIVYDHFANACNLTLVIETAAAIIDHHKQYMWRGPIRHKGDRQQKKTKKGDNWYILFVFVRKFEYRSQLDQTAQSMPLPLFVSAVVPRRVATLTPLSPLAILTTLTGYPRHLCYPSLRVVRNMITINLRFCIKIMTDR